MDLAHQETQQLIQELFAGQKCKKCGEQACRIRNGRFYCDLCVIGGESFRDRKTYKEPRLSKRWRQ